MLSRELPAQDAVLLLQRVVAKAQLLLQVPLSTASKPKLFQQQQLVALARAGGKVEEGKEDELLRLEQSCTQGVFVAQLRRDAQLVLNLLSAPETNFDTCVSVPRSMWWHRCSCVQFAKVEPIGRSHWNQGTPPLTSIVLLVAIPAQVHKGWNVVWSAFLRC